MTGSLAGNKTAGRDGVSGYVLEKCRNQPPESLFDILNCPIPTVKVPQEWRRVEVVPVYESGNKEAPHH